MKKIYLDYAAATPLLPEALTALDKFGTGGFHNPSSVYLSGRDVRLAADSARSDIAKILSVKPVEIIFCSGTTEANNLAISGVLGYESGGRIAVAATEHQSVLSAAEAYAPGRVDLIAVGTDGIVTTKALEAAIRPDTVLVSIGYANSETGVIQPLPKLSKVIGRVRQERKGIKGSRPLYFHTDASTAANYLPLKPDRLGVDLLSLGGAKIYGPKSSGILYAKNSVALRPLMFGGGQERGLRPGSEDAGQMTGLAIALKTVQASAQQEGQRVGILRDRLWRLIQEALPTAVRHGSVQHALPNILSLGLPIADGERLVMELDERGVQTATGAACSANTDEPSHVLLAMGLTPAEANSSLRLSLGRATSRAQIDKAAQLIISVVSQ